jgi:hypothetical protein
MPRRIEVELTSQREDGTWTWRAAGARQPKGTLDGSLLFDGAKVGDVVRADAEFEIDGIEIVSVLPPKGARKEPERIELIPSALSDDQLVITTLAPKGRGGRGRGDRERGRRGDRERGDRPEGRRERRRDERHTGEGEARAHRPRREPRPRPAPLPERPKPKRLRPLRHHRSAVLAELPDEERPIAEQVLRGGVPAVRQAVEKQNEQARADGRPEIKAEPLVAIAERLLPRLRAAEWRDRADAALANLDELDLRDLRSVVVAADTAARDDETRELANTLREGLNRRVEEEHQAWLTELAETIAAGRTVRALRLSSRPPKAGAPLPADLAAKLVESAVAAFSPDVTPERWATVLDAVAYSPVRAQVTPASYPESPSDEVLATVRKLAGRVPHIAAHFGIEPSRSGGRGRGRSGGATPPPPPAPEAVGPTDESPEVAPETEAAAPVESSAVATEVADAIESAVERATEAPVEAGTTTEETAPETVEEPAAEEAAPEMAEEPGPEVEASTEAAPAESSGDEGQAGSEDPEA